MGFGSGTVAFEVDVAGVFIVSIFLGLYYLCYYKFMKNLERILGSLLVLQILAYFMGLKLTYDSSHNGQSTIEFSSLMPFAIFVILGLINLILLIINIVQLRKKNKQPNVWLLFLIITTVILFVGYNYFVNIVSTLPGSDLPGY